MTGVLLVDKPQGLTSHDVVDKIRHATKMRRIGHTGTLDPAATGLLILCLGKATRLSEYFTKLSKVYEGVMRLGLITDSYDLDGNILEERPDEWPEPQETIANLSLDNIQTECNRYTGTIEQIPPMVSAVKVGGERLYKKARKGETVERKPRTAIVDEFKVISYTAPDAQLRVHCSSGTYVRSLCHEIGQDLKCGAVLAELRRTAVGNHHVDNALTLDELSNAQMVADHLLPMGKALDLPSVTLQPSGRNIVSTGGTITNDHIATKCPIRDGWVQVKDDNDELLALGIVEATAIGVHIHPKRVFI